MRTSFRPDRLYCLTVVFTSASSAVGSICLSGGTAQHFVHGRLVQMISFQTLKQQDTTLITLRKFHTSITFFSSERFLLGADSTTTSTSCRWLHRGTSPRITYSYRASKLLSPFPLHLQMDAVRRCHCSHLKETQQNKYFGTKIQKHIFKGFWLFLDCASVVV